MKKLVSVIVPVYNREKFVSETIESILSQSYEPIEIILINDGSTDRSSTIINYYKNRHPNKIRVINQENQGQINARNNGIKEATGDYIAFLDSDDLWLPEKLEKQIPLFEKDIGLVYSGVEIIDHEGTPMRQENPETAFAQDIFPDLIVKNRMTGGTVVVTKEALDKVGIFSTDLQAGESWELWLRISKVYRASRIGISLTRYRIHESNMSKDQDLMLQAKLKIMRKFCDLKSKDKAIFRASKMAYADYYYRTGLKHFAIADYKNAFKNFVKVPRFVFFYKDSWQRILRCVIGSPGNNLLRALK